MPLYNLATREDHIAPAKSAFLGSKFFGGPVKFVLSGSGHIAGVVNPPSKGKYQYWTGGKAGTGTLETWLKKAKEHPGSWWPDWIEWIKSHGDEQVAPREPGGGKLNPIEDAPGPLCEGAAVRRKLPRSPAGKSWARSGEAAMTPDNDTSRREFIGALAPVLRLRVRSWQRPKRAAQGARSAENRRLSQSLHGSVLDADQSRQSFRPQPGLRGRSPTEICRARMRCCRRSNLPASRPA